MLPGDSSRRRAEGVEGSEGGVGHHQRIVVGAPAALSADAQHHLGREELHHHLPAADGDTPALHEAGRRAVADRRVAADADRRRRRRRPVPQKRLDKEQRLRRVDTRLRPLYQETCVNYGMHRRIKNIRCRGAAMFKLLASMWPPDMLMSCLRLSDLNKETTYLLT